jgi:hypothetical protein
MSSKPPQVKFNDVDTVVQVPSRSARKFSPKNQRKAHSERNPVGTALSRVTRGGVCGYFFIFILSI